MKKDKQRVQKTQQKAQLKADRKKAEKAIKASLVTEFHSVIAKFGEPSKKVKKLIEKTVAALAKELNKAVKTEVAAQEPTEIIITETTPTTPLVPKKVSKPSTVKTVKKTTK